MTSRRSIPQTRSQSIASQRDFLAKILRSRLLVGAGSRETDQFSFGRLLDVWAQYSRVGSSLKMLPDYSLQMMAEISSTSPQPFRRLGMALAGMYLTADTLEFHRVGDVCSLSDVLISASKVPERYWLTPRAAQGLQRRAKKRGKPLPSLVDKAVRKLLAQ